MPMRNKIFQTIEKYGEFINGSIKKYKQLFPQYEDLYPQTQRISHKTNETYDPLNFNAQLNRLKSRNLFKSQQGKIKQIEVSKQRQQTEGLKTPLRQNQIKREQEHASLLSTHPTSPRPGKLTAVQASKLQNMFKKQSLNSGTINQRANCNGSLSKSFSKEQEEMKPFIVGGLKKDPKLLAKDRGFKQVTTKMFQQMHLSRQKTLWDFQPKKIQDIATENNKKANSFNSNQTFSKSRAQMLITKGIQKSNSQKRQAVVDSIQTLQIE